MPEFLSKDRSNYYKAKKQRIAAENRRKIPIRRDALFISYYGMDSFLQLFPEALELSISYHEELLEELQRIERKREADRLVGISMAMASTKNKKALRQFKRHIKDMRK